jgi:hypothetical protein
VRGFLACALLVVLVTGCGDDGGSGAGGGAPPRTEGFNGRFRAEGTDVLVLAERGDAVDLTMQSETVTGRKVAADRAEGEGAVRGGRLKFVLLLVGDNVRARFTVITEDGQSQELPEATFKRLPTDPPGTAARDPRLVAHWRHTESRASGEFSYVQDTHLVLEADGTMSTWDKTRSSAGGGDSPVTKGSWKTENDELFLRPDGGSEWASLGRYGLTETHLMLTRGSSKTVYERL